MNPSPPVSAQPQPPKQVLGIGDVVATSLAIFFRRLPVVALLALPAAIAMTAIFYLSFFEFWSTMREWIGISRRNAEPLLGFLTASLALGSGAGLAAGPLAGVTDAYLRGHPTPMRKCFGLTFHKMALTITLGIALASGVIVLMFVLVLLPGQFSGLISFFLSLTGSLYLVARWGPALPTITLERMGWQALRRSDWLSQGYRWPSTGALALIFVIAVILGGVFTTGTVLIVSYVVGQTLGISIGNSVEEFLLFLDFGIGLTIVLAVLSLGVAVIRFRLIEIKEPPDIEDMIDVFE